MLQCVAVFCGVAVDLDEGGNLSQEDLRRGIAMLFLFLVLSFLLFFGSSRTFGFEWGCQLDATREWCVSVLQCVAECCIALQCVAA